MPGQARKLSVILAGAGGGSKEAIIGELRTSPPRDDEDWVAIERACRRGGFYKHIPNAFAGLKRPYDAKVTAAFSKLVEDGCDMAMMVALDEIRREKLTAALPAIRNRLRRENGFHPLERIGGGIESLLGGNPLGTRRRRFLLGWALGELQDKESLDLLYATDEYFLGGGADYLARMGPDSLRRAIKIVKTEKGKRRNVAQAIIMASNYPRAYELLAELLPGADTQTRYAVAFALQGADPATPGLEALLLSLRNDPDDNTRKLGTTALFSRYPAKYRAEILECIVRPHWGPYPYALDRLTALGVASRGKVPGIDRELEEFIRSCGKPGPGANCSVDEVELAAEGIWRATGRKVFYERPSWYREGDGKPRRYPWERNE